MNRWVQVEIHVEYLNVKTVILHRMALMPFQIHWVSQTDELELEKGAEGG